MAIRNTQLPVEVLGVNDPNVRLTQQPVEVLGAGTPNVRLTQMPIEVLGIATTLNVRLTQQPIEILGAISPAALFTQSYIEILGSTSLILPIFASPPFYPFIDSPGATIKIFGSFFTGATAVTFNGTNATSFSVVNDTLIVAVTPSSFTSGFVAVTIPSGTTTSTVRFGFLGTGSGFESY